MGVFVTKLNPLDKQLIIQMALERLPNGDWRYSHAAIATQFGITHNYVSMIVSAAGYARTGSNRKLREGHVAKWLKDLPLDMRDLYHFLTRSKRVPVKRARNLVEEQMRKTHGPRLPQAPTHASLAGQDPTVTRPADQSEL